MAPPPSPGAPPGTGQTPVLCCQSPPLTRQSPPAFPLQAVRGTIAGMHACVRPAQRIGRAAPGGRDRPRRQQTRRPRHDHPAPGPPSAAARLRDAAPAGVAALAHRQAQGPPPPAPLVLCIRPPSRHEAGQGRAARHVAPARAAVLRLYRMSPCPQAPACAASSLLVPMWLLSPLTSILLSVS